MAEEAGLVVDKEGFEKLLAHDKELSAQVRPPCPRDEGLMWPHKKGPPPCAYRPSHATPLASIIRETLVAT
jgi:hypothetical protein